MCFLLLLMIYQCQKVSMLQKNEANNINAIADTINYYTNKLGTKTASIKTLKLEKSQLRNTLLKKDMELNILASEFNKISHITKISSTTIIDTIKVRFKDSIPCVFERSGTLNENSYRFKYTINQKSIEIDSLSLPTKTTVITGIKKKWFFGAQVLTTDITNTNPYIKITKIESSEITLTQPWFKKWYIWLAAGTITGWFVAK
jgi:hypothetical protein